MTKQNRTITFYNMNFGDSFLIKEEKHGLLVDCGSNNMDSQRNAYMTSLIARHLSHVDVKNLLITHYHSDHFSSILDLTNRGVTFQNVYVRCLSKAALQFDISNVLVNVLAYALRSRDYRTAIMWLSQKLLYNLLAKSGTVRGLNNDVFRNFNVGSSVANVLWPPSDLSAFPKIVKKMSSYAEKVKAAFTTTTNDTFNAYIKAFYEYYEKLFEALSMEGAVSNGFVFEMASDEIKTPDEETVKTVFKTIKITSYLKKKMSEIENFLSIVFEIDSTLLMCGDATKDAMRGAAVNYCEHSDDWEENRKRFEIIKVPHHGTKDYFLDGWNLDKTELLIPNSLHQNNSLDIDIRYPVPRHCCLCLNNGMTSSCPLAQRGICRICWIGVLDFITIRF